MLSYGIVIILAFRSAQDTPKHESEHISMRHFLLRDKNDCNCPYSVIYRETTKLAEVTILKTSCLFQNLHRSWAPTVRSAS